MRVRRQHTERVLADRLRRHSSSAGRSERGSVLVLVPVGFLVVMLLGAIAVDSAAAYLGQRQLTDALAAAANDAATAGISNATFYRSGRVTLDLATIEAIACRSIEAQDDGGLHDLHLAAGVAGTVVELRASAEVDAVFGRMVPGFATRRVSAEAVAQAEEGAQAPAAPPAPGGLVAVDCPPG